MSHIVVLVKHVPDTWSTKSLAEDFTLHREGADEVIDEINEFAVEQALRLRDAIPGSQVVALTAGTERAEEALRKALAMGADHAVLLHDPALAGSDLLGTAWALNAAIDTIADVQVIVAGNASSDGSMGALPAVLSEYRQIPALTNVSAVSYADGAVSATRVDEAGHYQIEAQLPVILSVTEQADKPRFPNFKGIMAAKKAEITRLSLADTIAEPEQVGGENAATAVTEAQQRPERSQGTIVRGATAVDQLVEFLAAEKFIK